MTDYDRIVGILAFQLRMASAGALALFAQRRETDPDLSLLDFLIEVKALDRENASLLARIVNDMIEAHGGDAHVVIESFGGAQAVDSAFAKTRDGKESHEDDTLLAEHLPHGLPRQIAPETIGRYTGGSEYARGGIGRILLVHDEQIGRHVILKELLPQSSVSPTDTTLSAQQEKESPGTPIRQSAAMMARFLQEAKITGQLEHPSIVPVYELGLRTNGQLYYTMKLVRGSTLATTIAACKNLDDRIALLRSYLDICHAMAYAHSKNVIHRDLKPSNVMVGEFGECVVLDWGLAKSCKPTGAEEKSFARTLDQLQLAPETADRLQTQDKDVLGPPLYMSPEQARAESENIGFHSDVYSLGAILFEIITGRQPHRWTNTVDTVQRVGTVPAPRIREIAPNTPPELAAICDKALAFHAKERYPSARELAGDVERFLAGAVVEAYAYGIMDVVRRVYRQHKPLVLSSGLAALVCLAAGLASYISINNARIQAIIARDQADQQRGIAESEREKAEAQRIIAESERETAQSERIRAEDSEVRAAREKYVSDIRLAEAHIRNFAFDSAENTLLATAPAFRGLEWEFLIGLCNQEARLFQHSDAGLFSKPSPDGQWVLCVTADGQGLLWESNTGQLRHTWTLAETRIVSCAFSPDGNLVAIWANDGAVYLFETESGAPRHDWRAHDLGVHGAAFNSDGTSLVTWGGDGKVRIWSLQDISQQIEINAQAALVKFVSNGTRLLMTSPASPPVIVDAFTGADLAMGPADGRLLGLDGGAIIWLDGTDVALLSEDTFSEQSRFPMTTEVTLARFSTEHQLMLTASTDRNVRVWSAADGQQKQVMNFGDPILACHLSPDGKVVNVLSREGRIVAYDRESGAPLLELGSHRGPITTSEILPGSNYLLTGSLDGSARLWSTTEASQAAEAARFAAGAVVSSISGNGERIALIDPSGHLGIVDGRTGETLLQALIPISRPASGVALNYDGSRVATILDDFLVAVVSVPDGAIVAELSGPSYVQRARFSPSGEEVVTTSLDGVTRIFDANTGAILASLESPGRSFTDALYSPDGKRIAAVSRDGTVALWDRDTATLLFSFQLSGQARACAFSPDSALLAAVSKEGELEVWDVASQTRKQTLRTMQNAAIEQIEFSQDGGRLIAMQYAGAPMVWDLTLGLYLCELRPPNAPQALWIAFHGPSNALFTGLQDGRIVKHIPLTDTPSAPVSDRAALEGLLATHRARPETAPLPVEERPIYHAYLPASEALDLFKSLQQQNESTASTAGSWTIPQDHSAYHPLYFNERDRVTAVLGAPPAQSLAPGQENDFAQRLAEKTPIPIDIQRAQQPIRFILNPIAARDSERTITLSSDEARNMLAVALNYLEQDGRSFMQFSELKARQRGIGPNTNEPGTWGYWIPSLHDPGERDLLAQSGLEVGMRLLAVDDKSPPDFNGIIGMLESARESLQANAAFQFNLQLERGAFERVSLNYQSAGQ